MDHARTHSADDLDLESPDEAFEKLRRSFHERLRSDQASLETLTRALRVAGLDRSAVLDDIETFAHKLRGAALVFEFGQIADAAKGIELAAAVARANKQCDQGEPAVLAMMQALALSLSQAIVSDSSGALKTRSAAVTR